VEGARTMSTSVEGNTRGVQRAWRLVMIEPGGSDGAASPEDRWWI
jgi:hypothetical protein